MKRYTILWVSKHKPLPAQIKWLFNKFKGEIDLVIAKPPFPTAEYVIDLARKHKANIIIPVLPLSFIARLVEASKKEGFIVLYAEMEHLHNCKGECKEFNKETDVLVPTKDLRTGETFNRHFRFKTFKKIKEVKLVLEDL